MRTGPSAITVITCAATAWLATAAALGPLVTCPQSDPFRSPRAPRTVDISADGRSVAFESRARLVPADTDDRPDIYVLDRSTGRVSLESGDGDDDNGDGDYSHPRISGDGRYVVFEARPSHVLSTPRADVVLHDRQTGVRRVLTKTPRSRSASEWSRSPDISDDGRVVAFSSVATTLTEGPDANGALEDVYVVHLPAGTITRVSVTSSGIQPASGNSMLPSLSSDGRWLAFASTAALDDPGASRSGSQRPVRQVYLRDAVAGRTTRVTRPANRGLPNGDSSLPAVSADGGVVVFVSEASNLLAGDTNRTADVFLYDRESEGLAWVSRGADGGPASGESTAPTISGDGRFVAFQSDAGNLACARRCSEHADDINLLWDVFLANRSAGGIVRLSEDELGGWMESSAGPALDGTGSVVAFSSRHPVDAADRREDFDLFVRALGAPPSARFLPLLVHTDGRHAHTAPAVRALTR
jgi:Tol biopolymer transport system component